MSCERIQDLVAEHRDALGEERRRSASLQEHAEACDACRLLVQEEEDVRRTLAPLERVRQGIVAGTPRTHNPAHRFVAVAAAALFVAGLGLVLSRAPDSIAPGRTPTAERRWLLPSEITRDDKDFGLMAGGSQRLVRTPGGTVVLVTDAAVWVSADGKPPWKKLETSGWHPSSVILDGDRVSFLNLAPLMYITVDAARMEFASRVKLPGGETGKQWAVYLQAAGHDRYAVLGVLTSGALIFSRSGDDGTTWSSWKELARTDPRFIVNWNPDFVVTTRGLQLFYLTKDDRLACRQSLDRGETWQDAEVPELPADAGNLRVVRVAALGDEIHLALSTDRALLYYVGREGGRSWSPGVRLPSAGAETRLVDLVSGGATLAMSLDDPRGAGVLASFDRGLHWSESSVGQGIRGKLQYTSFFPEKDGDLLAALLVNRESRKDSLLLRHFGRPHVLPTLDDKGRRRIASLIDSLADESIATREAAVRALMEAGEAARPVLEDAQARSQNAEVKARLRDVLHRIESEWPVGQPVPEWWEGGFSPSR